MQNWFECRVKYTKIDEKSGKEKRVSEPYLVDAVSFTEAEERVYREMEAYIHGEFTVTNIRKANYSDVFFGDQDRWYKGKIFFIGINEDTGKEMRVSNLILVKADTVEGAADNIRQCLSGMTVDFDVVSVSESPIIDVFPYFSDGAEQKTTENGDAEV